MFVLRAISRFPQGTIHLVNVAPGPTPIVVSLLDQWVVCPDNGVLTMISHHHEIGTVRALDMPEATGGASGQIFFGRDIFAPAVARLARGEAVETLGQARDGLSKLAVKRPEQVNDRLLSGQIIHCDRFGNLVTNIHQSDLADRAVQRVEAGGFPLGPLRYSYTEVEFGKPLALMGGSGYLEVAYHGDRADKRLDFGPGIKVNVHLDG